MNKNITNDKVGAYIDSMYVPISEELEELRRSAEENHVPVILRDTETLLRTIMKSKQPAKVLEIGAAVGYSACVFAATCNCRVTTIEFDEETYRMARENIERLGYDSRITVRLGEAREVLEKLYHEDDGAQRNTYDMVFIDAAKSHYREFWDLSRPLIKEDGMIVCDNILMKGMTASDEFDTRKRYRTSIKKMRDFLGYINSLDGVETTILPVGDGLSISQF